MGKSQTYYLNSKLLFAIDATGKLLPLDVENSDEGNEVFDLLWTNKGPNVDELWDVMVGDVPDNVGVYEGEVEITIYVEKPTFHPIEKAYPGETSVSAKLKDYWEVYEW